MGDFLSHLLMRSTGTQPATAVLRPRLPTRFEPLQGTDEIPALSPAPSAKKSFAPSDEPSILESRNGALPIGPSTTTPEYRPLSILESPYSSEVPKPRTTKMGQKIQPSPGEQIQAVRSLPSFAESRQMIIAPEGHESLVEIKPQTGENHSSVPQERHEALFVESRPVNTKAAEENFPQMKMPNSVETQVRSAIEASFVEPEVRSEKGSFFLKAETRPATAMQSVPISSRRARMDELEQPQEQQRVVEIHIGRIEVRAAPSPTPIKRASQPATIMSLEDYLRSQSGDKR